MGREYTVQEALRLAIRAEKDSLDFYKKAAAVTRNERARKVFRLLAGGGGRASEIFFMPLPGG